MTRRPLHTAFLVLLAAVVFSACNRKPLQFDQSQQEQVIPVSPLDPTTRRSGVRNFRRLIAQLSTALNVATNNASLQDKLVTAFNYQARDTGQPLYDYYARTLDYIQQMNYVTTDQRRSPVNEANRLRVVSAFCEVAVTAATGIVATADARRGIFINLNLAQMNRADQERFIRAAAQSFRRDGQVTDAEINIVASTMSSIGAAVSVAAGWSSGCTIMAGDSLAGEL